MTFCQWRDMDLSEIGVYLENFLIEHSAQKGGS